MPSPRPLCRRLIELSAWRKRSNTNGRKSAGMPMPVSATRTDGVAFVLRQLHFDAAALRRELQRVRHQVPDNLLQAVAIAKHLHAVRQPALDLDVLGRRGRRQRLDGVLDDLPHLHRSDVEHHAPADNARDVEDVFDQLRLRRGVLPNDLGRALHGGPIAGALPQDVRPAHDGVERRPQLVRQGRQELVLQPVGAPRPRGAPPARAAAGCTRSCSIFVALLDLRRQRDVGRRPARGCARRPATRAPPARCEALPAC